MSYSDVSTQEAERLKALSKPERDLERVNFEQECDNLSRHEKLTGAQEARYNELLDKREYLTRLDKHDEIR